MTPFAVFIFLILAIALLLMYRILPPKKGISLNDTGEQFHLIFDYAPIGIAIASAEGSLVDVNQAYADILGYTREELKAGKFYDVAYPDDVDKSEAEYQRLVAGEKSVKIDKRLLKKDGSIIFVTQRLVLIRDQQNNPLFLVGMSVDITERIVATRKLQQREELYYTVLQNMAGIVFNCANDENWTMSYISGGTEKICGYPAEDFLANQVRSYASIIHPDDRAIVDSVIQKGIKYRSAYRQEYRLLHKNGDTVWVLEEGRGIFDENGNLLHITGTIFDITDRKKTEEKLQLYQQHLEDMDSARTKELAEKNQSLEEFNRLFVGREFRIKELRDEIKTLKQKYENRD